MSKLDSGYAFANDFYRVKQLQTEQNIQERLRYAYNEGKSVGAELAIKEVLVQVKAFIDKADHVLDENNHCWQADIGYNKEQIDNSFAELCKQFNVEI